METGSGKDDDVYTILNLKLQERKDGIDRMKESLLKYLGMSVMVEDAFSGEIDTVKTCVRSACYTERYWYAILRAFPSRVDFREWLFRTRGSVEGTLVLSDEFSYKPAYSSAFGADCLVVRCWRVEMNGCGCELSQGIL